MARSTMAEYKLLNNEFSRMTLERAELEALPRTRKDAKTMGSWMYYTGKPCCNGHLTARYTSSRECAMCLKRWASQRRIRLAPKSAMVKIDDLKLQAELKALEAGHGDDT